MLGRLARNIKEAFTQRTAPDDTGRHHAASASTGTVQCRALCERPFKVVLGHVAPNS